MTEIPRPLIHQFMNLLKQSLPDRTKRNLQQFVLLETKDNQLILSAQHAEGALRYQAATTTHLAPSVFCLPATWLTQAEGQQGTVTVEQKATKIEMRWQNQGIPYTVDCNIVAPAEIPDLPTSFVENPASLLKALDDASHCCNKDNTRYSLSRIQLRGHGEIVASDGRQLLMQRGFTFPWKDNVLIPRMALFGADLLQKEEKVQIGRTKTHVVLKAGDWTIWLKMDDGRYPAVEQVFPKKPVSTIHFSPGEATILLRCLKNLPGSKEEDSLVTVEGGDQVFIRAKEGEKPAVEMLFDQSYCSGKPVRFCTDRQFLLRALQLGLTEIHVEDADTPLLCKDSSRKYVWMPVSKHRAIPAGSEVVRIVPDKKAKPGAKPAKPKKVKRQKPAAAAAVTSVVEAEASEAAKGEKSSNRPSVFSRALTSVLQTVLGRCLMVFGRLLRQRSR